jgi:large subunit ribosomal protein L30
MSGLITIIKIRGSVGIKTPIKDTLLKLRLSENNHCVVFKDSKVLQGMLFKVKDYITYGIIDKETLKTLITKRGRLIGNKRVTEEFLKEKNITIDKLVDLFIEDPKKVYSLGIKNVFRLSPPSKGFERKGIKTPFTLGGALGDRKDKINDLLKKMM